MNIIPRNEWAHRPPDAYSGSTEHAGNPCVLHWIGPGTAATGKEQGILQARRFMDYHMDYHGWNDLGYSYVILSEGTILEGRGDDQRGAHAGHNRANGYAGILIMVGQDNPQPTQPQYLALQQLAQAKRYTQFTGHLEWSSTACPGPVLMPWIKSNRTPEDPTLGKTLYGFEEMPWDRGGIGPVIVTGDHWTRPYRELVYQVLTKRAKYKGRPARKVRLKDGKYAVVFYESPERYLAKPRYLYNQESVRNTKRTEYEARTGRDTRPYRVTPKRSYSYMEVIP